MIKSLFEQLDGTYHEENRYFIPDLRLPAEEELPIGIWGVSECQWHSSCEPTEPTGEKAASGLSEAVPQGYIHQSSHKWQAQRLPCRHRQAGAGTL